MDKVDRTLLWELCNNCRASYESLAKKVNLSPNAVKNRVQNLIDDGLVHQFHVVLAAHVFNASFFQATVITDGSENVSDFVSHVGEDVRVAHISILASISGGAYLVWGQYIGIEDLNDLARFLRSMKVVSEVEMYTLLYSGKTKPSMEWADATNLHKRVLGCLIDDPRLSISDIAECSGYSSKSVRRGLNELLESKMIWLRARPDLAAGGLVNIHVRIEWDEKETTAEKIGLWIQENNPITLWDVWITAHDPVLYAEFVVDNLQESQSIVLKIRDSLKVKSTATLVSYSSAKFPYLGDKKLRELLDIKQ